MKEAQNFRDYLGEQFKDPERKRGFEVEAMKGLPARISLYLARARKERGITQDQLAEMVGTSQAYIARFEKGRQPAATLKTLIKIAEALGYSLDFTLKPLIPVSKPKKLQLVKPVIRKPQKISMAKIPVAKTLKKAA